jgi:AcrR family transcriptional regulator
MSTWTRSKNPMSRDIQSDEVRSRVVAAAFQLFIEKGYEDATIRQISERSGVSSGSIYHFFSDKEGVFQQLTLQVFETTLEVAEHGAARHKDAYLILALKWAYLVRLFSADKRMAELFSVAYRSWKISQELLRVATSRHRKLLGTVLADWNEDQFFIATLQLGGVLSVLVDERVNLDSLNEEKRIRALLSTALHAFGVEPDKIQGLIQKAIKLLPPITELAAGLGAGDLNLRGPVVDGVARRQPGKLAGVNSPKSAR